MGEIVYRAIYSENSLGHAAYKSKYKDKKVSAVSRTSTYFNTKSIIGRGDDNSKIGNFRKPAGGYKTKGYDPVKRRERYLQERGSSGGSGKGSGGGSGKGSGGSGKGSGKGSSRGSGGSSKSLSDTIQKLREESSLNTEAQQEAAKRKIEDLKKTLRSHINSLSGKKEEKEGVNVAEIRGKIQSVRKHIESTGGDLQDWIKKERESLDNRIKALYSERGLEYKTQAESQKDKENASKARDKEVKSRADSIYKKKS